MDEELKPVAGFDAEFKMIVTKSGDGMSSLDFVSEGQTERIILALQALDSPIELSVDEIKVVAGIGYVKFSGDGKTRIRFLADIRGSTEALQAKVRRKVQLEMMIK